MIVRGLMNDKYCRCQKDWRRKGITLSVFYFMEFLLRDAYWTLSKWEEHGLNEMGKLNRFRLCIFVSINIFFHVIRILCMFCCADTLSSRLSLRGVKVKHCRAYKFHSSVPAKLCAIILYPFCFLSIAETLFCPWWSAVAKFYFKEPLRLFHVPC